MLEPVNEDERLIGARLLDFFATATPWHRALWNPGLCLTLRELLEASEAVHNDVLHKGALKALGSTCLRLSGQDPGAGGDPELKTLQGLLRQTVSYDGLEYHALHTLTEQIQSSYLIRWAKVFRQLSDRPKVERTARSAASHMLDLGFSSDYLHRWWKFKLQYEKTPQSLADIFEDAHAFTQRPVRNYEVLVVFKSSPATKSGYPPRWLNSQSVSQWLKANSSDVSGLRPTGGIVLTVEARDAQGASQLAGELVHDLAARVAVGTGTDVQLESKVWVRGVAKPFPLTRQVRGVRVRALYREDRIYPGLEKPGIIDAAIELLSHLEGSSPSAATAGGWAAIEALLSAPNDRATAADRLAALVACSFPRAELTVLSYVLNESSTNAKLRAELSCCTENRERCSVVAKAIQSGQDLDLRTDSDLAARARIEKLVKSPRMVLRDVRNHTADAFRRLYRQRNLVLHWGKTDGVALRTSLRTAAPLVGAGMDRIVHGWYVEGLRPIELAARAHLALETVPDGDVDACLSLLATPHGSTQV